MFRLLVVSLVALALLTSPLAAFAQTDAISDLLSRISALRVQNGLAPLALNDQLSAAAQGHSQDMANTGNVSHTGSDGSTSEQRIRNSGYGPTLVAWGENIYGGGIATVNDAWDFWTTSRVHRDNLLSERYREIGIGVAASANGTYYTLNFGSRPGVLPFFVDQGSLLSDPSVTLRLSNEDAAPGGSGGAMGRAVEVRVGEGEDVSAVAWQLWQRSIPFTLSNAAGQHRITVEYRDAKGIVASYFRIVTLTGVPADATSTPTAEPTGTPTEMPTATPTPIPTDMPAPTATPTAEPSATFTPEPSITPTPSMPAPTATSVSANVATLVPTLTPPPTAPALSDTPASPSDASADRSPLEVLAARGWSDAPLDLLGLAVGLQIAIIVVGAVFLARRSTRS